MVQVLETPDAAEKILSDLINKFTTNKLHVSMHRRPLLRVSAINYSLLHGAQIYILKDKHGVSTELCQIRKW
jgi:hypothetical protein